MHTPLGPPANTAPDRSDPNSDSPVISDTDPSPPCGPYSPESRAGERPAHQQTGASPERPCSYWFSRLHHALKERVRSATVNRCVDVKA